MDATLVALSAENETSGWAVFGNLFDGVGLLTIGSIVAFSKDREMGQGVFRGVLTSGCLLLGGTYLVFGVRGLVGVTSTDEDRLARFRSQKKSGALDALTLARYEGELQAEAAISKKWRISAGVGGVAFGAAGATLIAFTATSELRHDAGSRFYGYTVGGLWLILGTWEAIAKFSGESSNERAWREYQTAAPQSDHPDVHVAIAPLPNGGFGLGLAGRF